MRELRLQVGHVVVPVDVPPGLGEPDPVDDRGVVELVGDDGVLRAGEGREAGLVGVPAGGVEDGVVGLVEARDRLLELLVQHLRSADEPHRAHPGAPLLDRLDRGLTDAGVVGEPEVVVGGEHDHLAAVHLHAMVLGAFERDLHLVGVGLVKSLDLSFQELQELLHRSSCVGSMPSWVPEAGSGLSSGLPVWADEGGKRERRGERVEEHVGLQRRERLPRGLAARHRNCTCTACPGAADVRLRIPHDTVVRVPENSSPQSARARSRATATRRLRSSSSEPKAPTAKLLAEPGGVQLDVRAATNVPGQQADGHVGAPAKGVPGARARRRGHACCPGTASAPGCAVAVEDLGEPGLRRRARGIPASAEELEDDLRVGLAGPGVVLDRAGSAKRLVQGHAEGLAGLAVRGQQRPVNVEEDESVHLLLPP